MELVATNRRAGMASRGARRLVRWGRRRSWEISTSADARLLSIERRWCASRAAMARQVGLNSSGVPGLAQEHRSTTSNAARRAGLANTAGLVAQATCSRNQAEPQQRLDRQGHNSARELLIAAHRAPPSWPLPASNARGNICWTCPPSLPALPASSARRNICWTCRTPSSSACCAAAA